MYPIIQKWVKTGEYPSTMKEEPEFKYEGVVKVNGENRRVLTITIKPEFIKENEAYFEYSLVAPPKSNESANFWLLSRTSDGKLFYRSSYTLVNYNPDFHILNGFIYGLTGKTINEHFDKNWESNWSIKL
jgi:hypothetical protein